MPIIKILIQKEDKKLDLKIALEEIAAKMGMEPERLNLFVELYPSSACYRASGNDSPIIHVAARQHNGQEWIQSLMTAAVKAVARQLNLSEASIMVYAHTIEDGYLRVNGQFI